MPDFDKGFHRGSRSGEGQTVNGKFTEKELEQAIIELFEKQDYVHV